MPVVIGFGYIPPLYQRGDPKSCTVLGKGPFTVISDIVFRIKKDASPLKNLVVHYNRLKPYRLSTISQPDSLDPWDYLSGDPTHPSDNKQGSPTIPKVAEDQDQLEQPASLPQANEGPVVELRRSTRIRRPVIHYGDIVTY
jgi:hypothetical protein